MNKGIKIKAFMVFMAWVVIFLHSVIPHQHQHDQYSELKNLVHFKSSLQSNNQTLTSVAIHDTDHDNICNYTDNLFHQLNAENLFPVLIVNIDLIPSIDPGVSHSFEKEEVIPAFLLYPNSLRAPPIA